MQMEQNRDRLLDRTIDVERAVIAGILVDPDLLTAAQEHVTGSDFFRVAFRIVFETCEALARTGKPIDALTVLQAMSPKDTDEVGGAAALARMLDGVPPAMNVGYYARLVRDYSIRRALEWTARHILSQADTPEEDASVILEGAERAIFALRDRTIRADVLTPRKRATDTFQQLETITAARGALRGVPTGLRDLDADLRGLHAGNLIVVGARPSMGKSAIALTCAINGSEATQRPALFFSLEMSAEELNLREVTMRARVDSWRLTHGRVSEAEQQRLAAAIGDMQEGGVHIVDAPILTVSQISAISRRAKAAHGLSLIVVDYAQLITPDVRKGRTENRTLELGEMSRALKGLARDIDVPVVLLSQLSRVVEARADKRPQLSDLRESGSLEQDADVVLLLYRPNAYEDIRKRGEFADHFCECIIAKHRNGPIGPVKLSFFREHTRFVDYIAGAAA